MHAPRVTKGDASEYTSTKLISTQAMPYESKSNHEFAIIKTQTLLGFLV